METDATLFNTFDRAHRRGSWATKARGLRRLTASASDALVAIPMMGAVESLNVRWRRPWCLYATQAARMFRQPVGMSARRKPGSKFRVDTGGYYSCFGLGPRPCSHSYSEDSSRRHWSCSPSPSCVLAVQLCGRSGQPDARAGRNAEQKKELRESLGLDQPDYVQFAVFVKNAVKGSSNLASLKQGGWLVHVDQGAPAATLELALVAGGLALIGGLLMGFTPRCDGIAGCRSSC